MYKILIESNKTIFFFQNYFIQREKCFSRKKKHFLIFLRKKNVFKEIKYIFEEKKLTLYRQQIFHRRNT